MKAIISLARKDGSFPEVGMTDRTIMEGTVRSIRQRALRWAGQRRIRIEYHTRIFFPPFLVEYW